MVGGLFSMGYVKHLGQRQIGERYNGERIYHVAYCKCGQKVFLCESEFTEMLDYVGWELTNCSFREFLFKKYHIKLPRIRWE